MHTPLTYYNIPEDMQEYLSYYGWHFNKKLFEFATSKMMKKDAQTERMIKVVPPTMEEVKAMLTKYKVEIDTNDMYDALYLAAMVKADYWGSSIEDDEHMAKYIKDVICDPDGYDGIVLCRYLADCSAKGIAIHWDLML